MPTLAGQVVNTVRDLAPDPVYLAGVPQPDTDGGLIRAQSLYRFLDDGVKLLARACGAIIEDWTALAQVVGQPFYPVDAKWYALDDGFSQQWRLDRVSLQEVDTIWPSTPRTMSQSLAGFYRKRANYLEFSLYPIPSLSDPATTLSANLGLTSALTDVLQVAATTRFLTYGYVGIDSEVIAYQQLSSAPVGVTLLTRGVCGTTATTHTAGATVQHLGLWLKGERNPTQVVNSTSVLEVPDDVIPYLNTYLLAQFRRAENEHEEARALMKEFKEFCDGIRADPFRKENRGVIRAYGEAVVGPLVWGGEVIRP